MKITHESAADLAKMAKAVAAAADRSRSIPALACIRLTATDGEVEMLASTLDHATAMTSPTGAFGDSGVAVVPATPFVRVLSSMSGEVTIETEGDFLVLTSKRGEASLQCQPPDSYPNVEAPTGEWVDLPAETWSQVRGLLHFTNASAPRLVSVTFDGRGHAWASDTYGLGWTDAPEAVPAGIVATQAIELAADVVGEAPAIAIGERRVFFRGDRGWVSSTSVLGDIFDRWDTQYPADDVLVHSIHANADELADAIAFATTVEDPNATAIRNVRLSADEGGLLVARSVQDMGAASSVIAADVDWPNPTLCRPDRLLACLRSLGTSEVLLRTTADGKRLTITDPDGESSLRQMLIPFAS